MLQLQKRIRLFVVLSVLCGGPVAMVLADDTAGLRLVPFPKQVTGKPGTFALQDGLVLQLPAQITTPIAARLSAELQRAGVTKIDVRPHAGTAYVVVLAAGVHPPIGSVFPEDAPAESYCLDVTPDEVRCSGVDSAGLLCAVQTLCQLIRANRTAAGLPCLEVRDWPSLRWRCFQDDLTRGPSSTPETLRQHVDLGSELKMNLFTYYMEYQYAFEKHPLIGPPNGSLSPGELSDLVKYAAARHVDILGNQQSFGHLAWILKHPEFAELRETENVLCPTNDASYQLLDDLYSEVCPLLPFPMFNVCCDETFGLGDGPSKALAEQIGAGGVYVRHIRRVHDLLQTKYAKRMMMWGDIILQHPDQLDQIPKDTVMLTWGYGAAASFDDQIAPFTQSGYEFFVCPGISNWSRILPDFSVATQNIQNFVRDGAKQGALGMLNTEWEDDGEALQGYKWHGYAWGAECAWNASTTTPEDFNRRIGGVLFGEPGDHFGQAIQLLAQTHSLPSMNGMMNSRFWEEDLLPTRSAKKSLASAQQLLDVVRPAIEHLEACRRDATVNAELLDAFLFGARRMELIGQRTLDRLRAAEAYAQACETLERSPRMALLNEIQQLIEGNRSAHAALGSEFARIWLSESKPYALDWTLKRYRAIDQRYEELIARVVDARTLAERGEPLPAAEQIGLQLPVGPGRRTNSQQVEQVPLKSDAPWLEPLATHRLGIAINAGDTDRYQLPVELDVDLPEGLASKPVRAFHVRAQGESQEVLAQLDRVAETRRARLVLLLPGVLPKDETASLHVYLGLSEPPAPLKDAAYARDGENGSVWLGNKHVQLLLGTEGAHVYTWQLKALSDRDVTMPGTSDWAGFSDLGGGYRHAVSTLTCVAKGPALVRYQCSDSLGMDKTISLFGGCSWMEVMLSDPVAYYWDFDNPQNFAADGPTPGKYLFSTGVTGSVGREADAVAAQVKADNVQWAIKFADDRLALGLATPETTARFVVAPGAGAGGVGIEGAPPVGHCVTFAGLLDAEPAITMERLRQTLDLRNQPGVILHIVEKKP
ncbi:MAG: glycoside hydrolase family 20 zincin-like fold domain-containing protein [Pirellulaceae bacterium]